MMLPPAMANDRVTFQSASCDGVRAWCTSRLATQPGTGMVATVNAAASARTSASGESVRSATVMPAAAAAWIANETATTR